MLNPRFDAIIILLRKGVAAFGDEMKMGALRTLFYCAREKPFMAVDEDGYHLVEHPTGSLEEYEEKVFNGTMSFEGDCKEVLRAFRELQEYGDDKGKIRLVPEHLANSNRDETVPKFFKRSGLSEEELLKLAGKNDFLYFYRFDDIARIKPFSLACLYEDVACSVKLAKIPDRCRIAYRKEFCEDPTGCQRMGPLYHPTGKKDIYWSAQKIILFPISAPSLCYLANGDGDLAVSKYLVASGLDFC